MSAVGDKGYVIIALRVSGGGSESRTWDGGTYDGFSLIADYSELLIDALNAEIPFLLLIALFLVIGMQHLYLYGRNSQLQEYLWYGKKVMSKPACYR